MKLQFSLRTLVIAVLSLGLLMAVLDGHFHFSAKVQSVQAEFISTRGGKPPMKYHSIKLTLKNPNRHQVWIILPYWGDQPLPASGVFPNRNWKDQPFGGKGINGDGGSVVEILMYGGDGFKAFQLPPKGNLVLNGYTVGANKDIQEFVIVEAEKLLVNGKTPLEKWLPYETLCGQDVKVSSDALNSGWKNLDWNAQTSRARDDYPKDKVDEVKAQGMRKLTVRFPHETEDNRELRDTKKALR